MSSQAVFVNWKEAVIELPIKLQIFNGGNSAVPFVTGTQVACTIDQLVPKASTWYIIDSVQVVVDNFMALAEWDYNYDNKWGITSYFVRGECSWCVRVIAITALDQKGENLAFNIMGDNASIQAVSKPQVYVCPTGAAGTTIASSLFSLYQALRLIYVKKLTNLKEHKGTSTSATSNSTKAAGTVTATNIVHIINTFISATHAQISGMAHPQM
ncbi:uncharacterized protein PHALS_11790 [Plasmopara halstedii]|uniref:Uncharacterized protein n=1 Tax=Plasmopara halstedii TaxID=4781 RepID=A0A0N7L5G9_PLAHL|nr:uncharacterized protein PHALS_11790 [Plasmopara halstedii]CEG41443.1 hypothetical protein PHALS_11790 [Plasmopara halstedii]|eukprot:XP_024577812.1 hypothetical protein PHALS_11790 [Plasmopara halstedii]